MYIFGKGTSRDGEIFFTETNFSKQKKTASFQKQPFQNYFLN
jgi:hypothetical protein